MSLLDALQRGWWSGWAEAPELVAGGAGLLESLIPGEQESITSFSDRFNRYAEDIRDKGPEGESKGLLEKIAEGLGAAPGTLATMVPFLAGTGGAGGVGVAAARMAGGMGLHSLVRSGDEGLPTAIGHGITGSVEGALFGGAGKLASGITGRGLARDLLRKQSKLNTIEAREAMQPAIDAALNTGKMKALRRGAHAVGAGGVVGGMGLLHGQPIEDVAASATTMGLLGALGGVTPKQIKHAGTYESAYASARKRLDDLDPLVRKAGEERVENLKRERALAPQEELITEAGGKPPKAGEVPASDFEAAGYRSRPYEKETEFFKDKYADYGPEVFSEILKDYRAKGKYVPRSDADTNMRASREIYRDSNGKVQGKAEDLDAMAWFLEDSRVYNGRVLDDLNIKLSDAQKNGDMLAVESLQLQKEAHLFRTMSDHAQLKGVRSVTGNAMRVLGRFKRNTPEWIEAAGNIKDKLGVDADRVVRMLEMSQDNPVLMQKILRAADTPKLWDYFQEYWINGLLSGVPTHMVNITSNAFRGAIDVAEKRAALELEMREGRKKLREAQNDPELMEKIKSGEEYILSKQDMIGEFQADLSAGINIFTTSLKAFGEGLKKENWDAGTMKPEYRLHQQRSKLDNESAVIEGPLGKIIRFPGRALQAMDVAFKIAAGDRAAAAKAYRMASEAIAKGKISPEQRVEYMAELRGAGKADVHPEILRSMKSEGQFQTFTEKLPPWMAPVEKLRQTSFKGIKPLVGVLPFLSTPFNVIKQAALRSPIGFLNWKNLDVKYDRGEISAKKMYQEKAATVIGTTAMVALVGLARGGLITGSGPVNQQDRQNLIATGWRPYSIHAPGMGYMQIQRIEPLGTILGMAADIAEFGDSEDKMGKAIAMLKDNLTDKSFLYGLESLAKAWSNPEQFASTYYKQMSGSLVPTLFAKAEQAVDPYARVTEWGGAQLGIPDAMAYRIPGLSQELPMKHTPLGKPQERWGVMSAETTGERYSVAFSRC
jgi:hypothetical protein